LIGILRPKGGRPKAVSVSGGVLVAAVLALGFALFGSSSASADTRSLKLYNMHTREKAEIVFKRNGRYDQSGLRKLNQFLRDWRKNEPTKMDPRLFDLLWEAYRQTGARDYINVVCGYRSPATNSMLRSRSRGVAKKSQHMLGKAMDFYIPGVKLKKLREVGLKMQGGGVGYYPSSGSPFVHFDVGNVRHWPKMSRRELIALFPNGKTLHVPSDGKPLPGFDQAVAAYQSRKKSGDIAIASAGSSGGSRSKSLLASLFGGGEDEEEDISSAAVASAEADEQPAPSAKVKTVKAEKLAKAEKVEPQVETADNKIRILSPDQADRVDVPGVSAEPEQEAIVAALPDREVPVPLAAPRPQVEVGATGTMDLYGSPDQAAGAAPPIEELALNIPIPTARPDYGPPPELAGDAAEQTVVASADVSGAGALPLPAARPGEDDVVAEGDEIAPIIAAGADASAEDADTVTVASLPSSAPAAIDSAFPMTAEEIIPEAKSPIGKELAFAPPTPRSAVVSRDPGTDPTTAATPTVKTTPKAARASGKAKRPAKQPRVLAAQPADARWALDSDYVTANASTAPPSYDQSLVRGAPKEVYTAGFQQDTQLADSRRFTGKAVTFLGVAKFQTN
jgi:uncharacterized protein YcbK (DUF882 family)